MNGKIDPGEVLKRPAAVLILNDDKETKVAKSGDFWYRVDDRMVVQTDGMFTPFDAAKARLLEEGSDGIETTVRASRGAVTDSLHGGVEVKDMKDQDIIGVIEVCQSGANWHRVPEDDDINVRSTRKYNSAIQAIVEGGKHQPK